MRSTRLLASPCIVPGPSLCLLRSPPCSNDRCGEGTTKPPNESGSRRFNAASQIRLPTHSGRLRSLSTSFHRITRIGDTALTSQPIDTLTLQSPPAPLAQRPSSRRPPPPTTRTAAVMADRDKFSLFDADGDGCITIAELPLVLYAHGCNPTVKEAEALAARCPDPNRIDFNTFASILGQSSCRQRHQRHEHHSRAPVQPLARGHSPTLGHEEHCARHDRTAVTGMNLRLASDACLRACSVRRAEVVQAPSSLIVRKRIIAAAG